jgi:hypothetical protein
VKALIALLVVAIAPAHLHFAVLGIAAEILTAAVTAWLVVRVVRRFRSAPWMRPVACGAW